MNYNTQKHTKKRDEILSPDSDTYIKDYKPKIPSTMLKSLHSDTYQEKEARFSQPKTSKVLNFNYGNNTMSRLKNELQTLKLDFSQFFGEQSKAHGELFLKSRRSTVTRSPKPEDEFEVPRQQSSKIISQVQYIEQENMQLKNELKKLRLKYDTKKEQYKQIINFLHKKIDYLQQQLQINQENMMEVKNELQQQMQIIRDQLTRKRDAQITLQDYGQLIQINSQLKEQILLQQNTVNQLKYQIQFQRQSVVKQGQMNLELKNKIIDLKERSVSFENIQIQYEKLLEEVKDLKYKKIQTTQIYNATIQSLKSQLSQSQTQNKRILGEITKLITELTNMRTKQQQIIYNSQRIQQQAQKIKQDCQFTSNKAEHFEQQLINANNHILHQEQIIRNQGGQIQHLILIVRNYQENDAKKEQQRIAMLNDIQFMTTDLINKTKQNECLKTIIAEREDEILYLREIIEPKQTISNTMVYKQKSPNRLQIQQCKNIYSPSNPIKTVLVVQQKQHLQEQQKQFKSGQSQSSNLNNPNNKIISENYKNNLVTKLDQTQNSNWIKLSSQTNLYKNLV